MRRTASKFYIFLICFIFSINCAQALSPKQEVEKAYETWCNAISEAKGDPKVIVKLYAPGALLIPTLSSKILRNVDNGLDEYFKKLTSLKNIKCAPQELITHVESNLATNSGLYTFSYTQKDGITKDIPARFTFIYKKMDNQWLIIKHHSSKMPE